MADLHGFCTLPGELRNQIYEQVAEDDRITVLEENAGDRFSVQSHYLSRFNNIDPQIQKEHVSVAYGRSRSIETTVRDFDFAHLMAFLDDFNDDAMKTFPTLDRSSTRRFIIRMEMTAECPRNLDNLTRWLDRFRQGCKGSEIEFEYEAHQALDNHTKNRLQSLLSPQIVDDIEFAPAIEVFMIRLALIRAGRNNPYNRDFIVDTLWNRFGSRRGALEYVVQCLRHFEIRAVREGLRDFRE